MSKRKAIPIIPVPDADALRTLNERIALVTDVAAMGVWGWDPNNKTATWDDRMFDICGIPRTDSVSSEMWSASVHPEDLARVERMMQEAVSKKTRVSTDFRIIRPDGSVRYVYGAGGAVVDDQQNVVSLTGIILDITERKQSEEAIQRRVEELDTLQETVLDITKPHELSDLLFTIVERAAHLLDADGGGLYLCDEEKQEVRCVVSYNTPHDYKGTILKYGEGMAGRIGQTGESIKVGDYRVWPGRAKVFDSDRPFRSTIGVPLIWQGRVTGVIDVLRYEDNKPFTENDQELLKLFANHAAIACENARALEAERAALSEAESENLARQQVEEELLESERRTKRLLDKQIAINQLALALGETLDLNMVYTTMYQYIRELTDAWVFIVSSYNEQEKLIQAEYAMYDGEALDVTSFPPIPLGKSGRVTQSQVIHTGEPLFVPNSLKAIDLSEKRYHIKKNGSLIEITSPEDVHDILSRSALYVPMKVKGKVNGVMQFQSTRENAYTPEDIELAAALANVAAIAVENARLYEEVQQELNERTRAEDVLRKNEAKYRNLLENIPQKVFYKDKNLVYVAVNPSYAKDLGISPNECIGKTDFDFYPKELAEKYRADDMRIMEAGITEEFEESYEISGDIRTVHTHKTVMRDNSGNTTGILGIFWDITERKQAERELQAQRDFSYQVMNAMGQGLTVSGEYDRFEYVNPTFARMTGYSPEELIGKSPRDFTPADEQALLFREEARRQAGESSSYEIHLKHRNGNEIPIMVSAVPSGIANGTKSTIAVITDLTERKQAEEALRRERDRAQQYFDIASVMLVALNAQGKIMMANRKACEVLGYEEQEVLGKNWVENFIPKRMQEKISHVFDILLDGNVAEGEFNENPVLTRNGEERLVLWHNTIIRDETGRIIGHLGSGEDITERKRAEEKASREMARVAALARVAERMNAQLDFQTVLDIICEETAQGLRFPAASINLLHETGDYMDYAAGYGIPPAYVEQCRPTPSLLLEEYTRKGWDLFTIPDIQAVSDLPNADLYKELDFRTVIAVKLERDDRIVGMLGVNTFGQTREISEDDKAMLHSLGNLAVQAIVNARLYENVRDQAAELERSNELLSGLARVSAELQTTLDPEQMVEVLGKELKSLGISSFLAMLDSEENALIIQGASLGSKALARIEKLLGIKVRGFRIPRESLQECFEALVTHRRSIFSPDIVYLVKEVSKVVPGVSRSTWEESLRLFEELGSHGIYLPLTSGDRSLGVLGLHSPDLRKSDVAAFSVFANNISAALENARLYQAVQSELEERKRTEAALQEAEARYRALVEQIPAIAYTDSAEEMGQTLYINPQLKTIAGYDPEEWISDNDLWMKMIHPEDRERVLETYVRTFQAGEPFNVEYRIIAPDGRTIWFHDEAALIRNRSGQPLFWQGIMLNVTNQKLAEAALRKALAEKEVLLREVHHRVKNNLQAIIYLIEGRIGQVSDAQTILLLKGLQEQARTMALVYEQLYQSENLAEVKMKRYLQVLAESIMEAFSGDRPIEMSVESEEITLDVGTAMPCGLMVTELLTNSLKHAFPPGFERIPYIKLILTTEKDHHDLVVRDNGVGLPADLDERAKGSMGLRLVRLWATHQMGGTFEVERGEGTVFHVTFPKKGG